MWVTAAGIERHKAAIGCAPDRPLRQAPSRHEERAHGREAPKRHRPRLRALSDLNANIAEAEREVARWERVVERMNAAGEPTRKAREFLRAARDEPDRLDRARDVLLEGGGEREEEPRERSREGQAR
jgi:hypothetical protein